MALKEAVIPFLAKIRSPMKINGQWNRTVGEMERSSDEDLSP
jgi:hypothetical protein